MTGDCASLAYEAELIAYNSALFELEGPALTLVRQIATVGRIAPFSANWDRAYLYIQMLDQDQELRAAADALCHLTPVKNPGSSIVFKAKPLLQWLEAQAR